VPLDTLYTQAVLVAAFGAIIDLQRVRESTRGGEEVPMQDGQKKKVREHKQY